MVGSCEDQEIQQLGTLGQRTPKSTTSVILEHVIYNI